MVVENKSGFKFYPDHLFPLKLRMQLARRLCTHHHRRRLINRPLLVRSLHHQIPLGIKLSIKMTSPQQRTNHKLCMIPGPIEFHEDVLAAMSTAATSHVDPDFINTFGESLELLRHVFLAKEGQPFVVAGSGTLGWDMVVSNLLEPGDEVCVVNTGYFGDAFARCAESYGFKVTHVHAPVIGDQPSVEAVKKVLQNKAGSGKQFKLLNITQVDTSTGVLANVKAISEMVKYTSPKTLISVDGVCSIGGEELRMDEWGVDVAITASQKALGTPGGLCVLMANSRAVATFESRRSPVANYYANWANWLPIMRAYESRKPSYFATPPVNLIYALNASLKQFATEMDHRFEQHRHASKSMKDTLHSWGLKLVPVNREHAANTLSAVYYPEGMQASDLLPRLVSRGVVCAGGLHKEIGPKYFRIGHMGLSAVDPSRKHLEKVKEALQTALTEAGHKFPQH